MFHYFDKGASHERSNTMGMSTTQVRLLILQQQQQQKVNQPEPKLTLHPATPARIPTAAEIAKEKADLTAAQKKSAAAVAEMAAKEKALAEAMKAINAAQTSAAKASINLRPPTNRTFQY